jgi:hypothetical protein
MYYAQHPINEALQVSKVMCTCWLIQSALAVPLACETGVGNSATRVGATNPANLSPRRSDNACCCVSDSVLSGLGAPRQVNNYEVGG